MGNFAACTIVQGDHEDEAVIVGGTLDGSFQPLNQLRPEGLVVANQAKLDPLRASSSSSRSR
jgi:hypothetical protein